MAAERTRILVVEDEPAIVELVTFSLRDAGWEVQAVSTVGAAWDAITQRIPDLVLLDWMLPDQTGLRLLGRIRADRQFQRIPVIMLTAKSMEEDKISGLDAGADDYITKPFSTAEFSARIRAQLRRARVQATPDPTPLEVDGLVIDAARRVVAREAPIHLTPTEWDLLRAFVAHRGRTLTHQQLFRAAWNRSDGDPQQYLRVHIANLRRKIERDSLRPRLIVTEPGVGYRFEGPD